MKRTSLKDLVLGLLERVTYETTDIEPVYVGNWQVIIPKHLVIKLYTSVVNRWSGRQMYSPRLVIKLPIGLPRVSRVPGLKDALKRLDRQAVEELDIKLGLRK